MTIRNNFGEVITAMVTPFNQRSPYRINWRDTERLANGLLENGSDSLLLTGSTGEAPQLSDTEREEFVTFVRKNTPKGTCIIVSTGSNNTEIAKTRTKKAFDLGADAVLVSVPEYNKPPQRDQFKHFSAIAQSVPGKPVIIYNIPLRTGVEILPETLARLVGENPNIIGIKQSMGNMDRVSEMKAVCPARFQIYSGDDSLTLPMLSLGATGVISVASHLEGPLMKEMISHFKNGQVQKATDIHHLLFPMFRAIFMTTNPIPIKEALYQRKMISSAALRTLSRMTRSDQKKLKKELAKFEFRKRTFLAAKERN